VGLAVFIFKKRQQQTKGKKETNAKETNAKETNAKETNAKKAEGVKKASKRAKKPS